MKDIQKATRSFLLAYGIRALLSLAFSLVKILKKPKLAPQLILQALGKDALRFGGAVGGFALLYRLLLRLFRSIEAKRNPEKENTRSKWPVVFAGGLGSFALCIESPSNRVSIAQYFGVRALQSLYNAYITRHPQGNHFSHIYSLLFALSSAQIMYGYAIRPDSIPKSYYQFILKTGPIDELVLKEVRKNVRGIPVDVNVLNDYVQKINGIQNYLKTSNPPYISNSILHPQQPNWIIQAVQVFIDVFVKISPLNLSLTFIPMILLRTRKLLKNPLPQLFHGIVQASRSTTFLSAFVSTYMFLTSAHRRLLDIQFGGFTHDHRFIYWIIGFFSSWSIFVEPKSRRTELALYAIPKALESCYIILKKKGKVNFPNGELALFSGAMAIIMYFHEYEQEAVNHFLNNLLVFFLDCKK